MIPDFRELSLHGFLVLCASVHAKTHLQKHAAESVLHYTALIGWVGEEDLKEAGQAVTSSYFFPLGFSSYSLPPLISAITL